MATIIREVLPAIQARKVLHPRDLTPGTWFRVTSRPDLRSNLYVVPPRSFTQGAGEATRVGGVNIATGGWVNSEVEVEPVNGVVTIECKPGI